MQNRSEAKMARAHLWVRLGSYPDWRDSAALGVRYQVEELTGGFLRRVLGASGRLAQQRLELGEELFDRVEIGAARWQVAQAGAGRGESPR
jgi:hypothetical protein